MRAEEILSEALRRNAAADALACEVTLSYAQAADRIHRLSHALVRLGVAAGERVAMLHRNCHRFFEVYFAALHVGAVLVPLNPRLAPAEMKAILEDARVSLLVSQPSTFLPLGPTLRRLPNLKAILWTGKVPPFEDPRFHFYEETLAQSPGSGFLSARLPESDPAHLYYTSGSTGRPKGVMLTRGNLAAHVACVLPELELDATVAWGHIAPMFHLADAWAVWAVTAAGGAHVFLPEFSAAGALALLEAGKVTMTNLVPTMLHRMLRETGLETKIFPRLTRLMSGGAAISPEAVVRILSSFRCDYVQTYGLTETSPFLTLSLLQPHMRSWSEPEKLRIRCTTGYPMRGVEVRVVGEGGDEVPRDGKTVGEIRARGPTVTPGYWNRPDEDAAAFDSGWLKTGDLAVVGPEGYLSIVDRKKDLINTGGEKVYSLEVENALALHPQVAEVAVVGMPDADLGEAVVAVVVAPAPRRVDERELLAHCAAHLSYFKIPRSVRFVEALPRTASGKILKRAVRESLLSAPAGKP